MADILKLTISQGNHFLQSAQIWECPEAVGKKKKFSPQARARMNELFRQAAKCLKKVSKKEKGDFIFGMSVHPTAWVKKTLTVKPIVADGKGGSVEMEELEETHTYLIVEADKVVEVEANSQARKGLYWISYFCAHPESPWHKAPGFLDEVIWPVVEQLDREEALKLDIGLSGDGVEPEDIEEPVTPPEKVNEAPKPKEG